MDFRTGIALIVAAVVFGLVGVQPADACTTTGQPGLLHGVEQGLWPGVYEQETIAWAPWVLIRGDVSASVVTRYWGEPPANLDIQYEGGELFPFLRSIGVDNCAGLLDGQGNILYNDGRVGTVGYGAAPTPAPEVGPNNSPEEQAAAGTVPWHRSAPAIELESGAVTGPLSADELAALERAYGSPQLVEIAQGTRTQAMLAVWSPTIVLLALMLVGLWFTIRFLLRRRLQLNQSQNTDRLPADR